MRPLVTQYLQELHFLAANIKKLRLETKLTQYELAEKINVELRYLQKLESGKKNPTIAVVLSIARTFNVKIEDLLSEAQLVKDKKGRPRKK